MDHTAQFCVLNLISDPLKTGDDSQINMLQLQKLLHKAAFSDCAISRPSPTFTFLHNIFFVRVPTCMFVFSNVFRLGLMTGASVLPISNHCLRLIIIHIETL